jgi:stage II sporulation protein E
VGILPEQAPKFLQKQFWSDRSGFHSLTWGNAAGLPRGKSAWFSKFSESVWLFFLAYMMSRVMLPEGVHPGAAPFLIVSLRHRKGWNLLMTGAGILGGMFEVSGPEGVMWKGSALLIMSLTRFFFSGIKRTTLRELWLFGVWVSLRLLVAGLGHPKSMPFITAGIELSVSLVFLFLLQIGHHCLNHPFKISKWLFLGLTLLIGICLAGTRNLRTGAVDLSEVLIVFVLMIASYKGGGGAGTMMGMLIGLVLGLGDDGLLTGLALYGMTGLFAGIMRDFGKWGAVLGGCAGLYFITRQPQFAWVGLRQYLSWGAGMSAFMLTPEQVWSRISGYFPEGAQVRAGQRQEKLKEIISARLSGVSKIFQEIAEDFSKTAAPDAAAKADLYSLLEQVSVKNCQHCNGYEFCWGKNFYSTYHEIFDLLAGAELYGEVGPEHLKGKLGQSCYQQYKLLSTVNHLFEKFQTELFWRRKFDIGKLVIAGQLYGMSNFISELADEVFNDGLFKEGFESSIKYGLNQLGISTTEVTAVSFGTAGLEIKLTQKCCGKARECQNLIAPMVGNVIGERYMVWNKQCYQDGELCRYSLIPEHRYEIRTTVCKLPKSGNEYSGDNHALRQLKDGHFVTILSDGMGHGRKAGEESRVTVNLLERLLEHGISRDFAVQMVNSMLALRSPEESFATVDMSMINLYNARAEFIKIGAAVTYIKRGREILAIKSTSLPVGILNTVDVERTMTQLQPGDLVIMVTDGIVDSKPEQTDKEEWLVRALSKVEVVGPEALGEYLLNLARINQDGEPKDDMTVVVLQINKKEDDEA